MDVYEGKCTCGDEDCARTLMIEPVYRISIVDEADELSVAEYMTRDQLLDWVMSDEDSVIQDACNELSIEPDGTSVWQWLDGAEDAALRRQLAKMEIDGAVGRELLSILRQQLAITEAEAADLRRQLEHANRWRDTAILEANEARAEAADLRRQLAAMTKMRDAAARGVEIREEILTRKTAEFKARLQAEINLRTLSTQDGEVDEFNAGYEACKAGQPIEAEPSDLPFDVWRQGWMVADYERMSAELSTLRRQLADAQAELLHYKTNGVSSIAQGRQIAFTATE